MDGTSFEFIRGHISDLIKRTYLDMGRSASNAITNHLSQRTTSLIEKRYREMDVEDYNNIFNLGVEGKFGEFKGLTFPTIARWFSLYHQSKTPQNEDFSMLNKHIKFGKMILEEIKNGTSKIPNLKEMYTNPRWIIERKKQGRFL